MKKGLGLKRNTLLLFVLLILVLAGALNAHAETYGPVDISLTQISSPSMIDRLIESDRYVSFRHVQTTLGVWETQQEQFTIKETGWVGFNNVYHSDLDAAGGARPSSISIYSDQARTQLIKVYQGRALPTPGTYYLTARFMGSYDYYGYFLPCKTVIQSAQMVIAYPTESYARVSCLNSLGECNYYLSVGPTDETGYLNFLNFSAYQTGYGGQTYKYKGIKYNIGFNSMYSKFGSHYGDFSSNYEYYLYLEGKTGEWKGWAFYAPVDVVIDYTKVRYSIKNAKITGIKDTYYYNSGVAIEPLPVIKLKGKTLVKDTDFTISYKNNKKVGKATVTIKGIGVYKGTVKKYFKILPNTPMLTSVNADFACKGIKVSWKSQVGEVGGYKLQYSLSKKFTKKKTKTIKIPYASSGYSIRNLKPNKKYYIRLQAYKKSGKTTYYSKWSAVWNATTLASLW